MTLQQDINKLKPYFLSKDGGIMSGEVTPDITDTHNLGRSDKRWDTIYCKTLVAEEGGGGEGGDADTVDGYDAAGNPLPSNLLALDPQSTFPISVYPQALIKDGSRALEGSLTVVAGATIDGVDIGAHAHTGVGSQGVTIAHANLTGKDADDHPQYTQRAQDEIITGDWMFTHLQDRSAGWLFLPDDKIFKAVPHNMIFAADVNKASISLGVLTASEYAIHIYDDDTPTTYMKIGRGDNSITLHGTDSTYKLWAGAAAAGSAPFHVKNDGAILAQSGVIAGWNIDDTKIFKNNMSLNSIGRIIAGIGNEIIQLDAADPTWRIWAGHATASLAPFRVNKVGQMYMYDAFVTGTLKSTNFVSGQSGFSLDSSGLAEFDQIIARGRLQAMVFAEAAISVSSGKMIMSDGAVVAVDIADTDDFIIVDADAFQQNDIIRVKPDAYRDEWMRITSPYTIVDEGFKYYVARGLNDTEPTWAGPYDFYAGESVVRLGSAQQTNVGYPLSAGEAGGEYGEFQTGGSGATTGGGYLILEGSRNFGPFFGVVARYGPVYDQLIDVVRIGNLNGILSYTTEEWGAFFGDDNQYFVYDQTDGLRIEFSGTDVDSSIDKYGIKSETFVFEKITTTPVPDNFEAKVWYELDGSEPKLKTRLKNDATDVQRYLGDMYKYVYDTNDDGKVDDSAKLGAQLPSYYTDIVSRLGYTPVNKAGDTMGGRLGQAVAGFHCAPKDDISTRIDSGFYQSSSPTVAEGWPVTGGWYHLLAATHNNDDNYYSMQFAADFYNTNNLFFRVTSNSGAAPWKRILHSGNATGSVTFVIGNMDRVLVTGEMVQTAFNFACTITEVHLREIGDLSGSCNMQLRKADDDTDTTWTVIQNCSFSSQAYKTITSLSLSVAAGNWIQFQSYGAGTIVKRIACTIFFTRT